MDATTTKYKEILERIPPFRAPSGRIPRDYKPRAQPHPTNKDLVELDRRTALAFRTLAQQAVRTSEESRFHLHSILMVSVWGSLESYFYALFDELFRLQPELLITQEKCTHEDVVRNAGDPVEFLIGKQLKKIGRFGLTELLEYLNSKTNFTLADTTRRRLERLYVLRNVIAHNSGAVELSLVKKLDGIVAVRDGEVRVTKADLVGAQRSVHTLVSRAERHMQKKFFSAKRS